VTNQTNPPWTPDREAKLEDLVRVGLTTSAIAERLGTTKNAVVGKVNRTAGLRKAMRTRDAMSQPKPGPKSKPKPVVPWSYPPHGGCHWPEGDPRDRDFHFCGAPVFVPGSSPYCEEHERRAYDPKPQAKSDG
jgi:GcrA cell cycle regulator